MTFIMLYKVTITSNSYTYTVSVPELVLTVMVSELTNLEKFNTFHAIASGSCLTGLVNGSFVFNCWC